MGLIDRLAARRLVERIRGEEDHREVLIVLTQAGEDLLRRLTAIHRKELKTAGVELAQALRRVLRKNA